MWDGKKKKRDGMFMNKGVILGDLTTFLDCISSETERCGVYCQDCGAEWKPFGEGVCRWNRAHVGKQDEVCEG